MRKHSWLALGVAGFSATLIFVACGSSDESQFGGGDQSDGGGALGDGSGFDGGGFGGGDGGGTTKPIDSIDVTPGAATLDVTSAPFPTQAFTVTAHFHDGTTGPVAATWTASDAPVGAIDGSGLYTPRGTQGGAVTITATAGGKSANAALTVKLHQIDNPAGIDAATQASLLGATTADGSIVWTYPYDAMAYPRGIDAPNMMWNNGASGDVYAIHIVSPTYELQEFTNATIATAIAGTTPTGARSFAFDPAKWAAFTDSTSGAATVTVTRMQGSTFTKLVQQTWTIASRSMSGSIYYWAINTGAVMRIKPGEAAPVNLLNAPNPGTGPYPANGTPSNFCPSCHTVSANGSTLVMGTGPWGQNGQTDVWSTSYDLMTSAATFNGYETSSPATRFPLAGVSADGKVIVENWAGVRGNPMGQDDKPLDNSAAATGSLPLLSGTSLETLVGSGHHTFFPAFSADNQLFVYVDSSTKQLFSLQYDATSKTFSNSTMLADVPGGGNKIAYPTISPDHRWVVYQVGPDFGSLGASLTGDLYAVDTLNPNHPIALSQIDTTMSAAAGAARDEHRSYEPTFAPVASGGYFWLVFHSRRTYGNELVGNAYNNEGSGTKQLWVAAIDVPGATASTADPSHPPFWLPGQDPSTLNMRGYWALDPCHGDGESCATGTDCCNGFCDTTNDAGAPICGKGTSTCSQVGDKCDVASDCCNSDKGVTCINHSCSEPPPR